MKGKEITMLRSIWQYRQFILSCIKREFLARYKGSVLGIVWSILQPLSMIFVYTVIFSEVMRAKLVGMDADKMAYSIYLCSGVLTWDFFTQSAMAGVNVFLGNGNLMKKLAFPRICLPMISVGSAFLNFCISFGLFFVALLIMGRFPFGEIIWFIPILVVQTIFACSFGIGLGVLNVFFRDVGQLFGVVLQFWFWFTPIVYPSSIIPQQLIGIMNFNPMYHIAKGYQSIFVYHQMPEFTGIFGVLGISVLLGIWSLRLYRNHVGEMVDEL